LYVKPLGRPDEQNSRNHGHLEPGDGSSHSVTCHHRFPLEQINFW